MKSCCTCHLKKSVKEFYKDKGRKDGLDARCKECCRPKNQTQHRKNYVKQYQKTNRKRITAVHTERHRRYLKSWGKIIPKKTNCEICNKEIGFNTGTQQNSIHFDHRNGGGEPIKYAPFNWLRIHKKTKENEKIWRSCDFGILCNRCNKYLPTKNRVEFLTKALKYAQEL